MPGPELAVAASHLPCSSMPGPSSALVVRFGAMGDMVLFSPVIAALAEYHGSPVDVLTNPGASGTVLVGTPGLGRVDGLAHRHWPSWLHAAKRRIERDVLARGVGTVWAFERIPGTEERWAAAGIRVKRCYGMSLPRGQHGSVCLRQLLAPHSIDLQRDLPAVRASADERAAARALLSAHGHGGGPLLVLQPGNSRTMHPLHRWRQGRNLKGWPAAAWRDLARVLLERYPDATLVLAGAPGEWIDCEEIRVALPAALAGRCLNLARELPVRLLAGLLAEAAACVGVDTGPSHLAAALGCPLAVLFGPADPAEMAPRGPSPVEVLRSGAPCSPCYGTRRRRTCRDNICMQRIGVAEVLAAVERVGLRRM